MLKNADLIRGRVCSCPRNTPRFCESERGENLRKMLILNAVDTVMKPSTVLGVATENAIIRINMFYLK